MLSFQTFYLYKVLRIILLSLGNVNHNLNVYLWFAAGQSLRKVIAEWIVIALRS